MTTAAEDSEPIIERAESWKIKGATRLMTCKIWEMMQLLEPEEAMVSAHIEERVKISIEYFRASSDLKKTQRGSDMKRSDSTPLMILAALALLIIYSAQAETIVVSKPHNLCPEGYSVEYATKPWEKTICYVVSEEKRSFGTKTTESFIAGNR